MTPRFQKIRYRHFIAAPTRTGVAVPQAGGNAIVVIAVHYIKTMLLQGKRNNGC